ncbi:MAG: hypothetical protein AAGF26_03420 [Cyanobacteria bacterium P01_G01_bin.49]
MEIANPISSYIKYNNKEVNILSQFNQSPELMKVWLSLATVPLVGGVLVAHKLAEELSAIGQNSEEIFRGDRLPILNFPDPINEGED